MCWHKRLTKADLFHFYFKVFFYPSLVTTLWVRTRAQCAREKLEVLFWQCSLKLSPGLRATMQLSMGRKRADRPQCFKMPQNPWLMKPVARVRRGRKLFGVLIWRASRHRSQVAEHLDHAPWEASHLSAGERDAVVTAYSTSPHTNTLYGAPDDSLPFSCSSICSFSCPQGHYFENTWA